MVSQDIFARAMVWIGANNGKGGGHDKWLSLKVPRILSHPKSAPSTGGM